MEQTLTLKRTGGCSIEWFVDADGLHVNSALSEAETRAMMPELWPGWLFEQILRKAKS